MDQVVAHWVPYYQHSLLAKWSDVATQLIAISHC